MEVFAFAAALGLIWMLWKRQSSSWAVVFACGLLTYSPFEDGVLSRVYPGILVLGIFLLQWLVHRRSAPSEPSFSIDSFYNPLLGIVLVSLASMILSRLAPDSSVSYTFPNSDVSLSVTQFSQLWILLATVCLPFAVAASLESWKDIEHIIIALSTVGSIGAVLTLLGLIYGFGGTWEILGIRRAYWEMPWHSAVHPLTSLIAPFLYAALLFGGQILSSRRLIALLFFICMVGVVLSFSRENWFVTFLQLSLLTALRLRRHVVATTVAIVATLALFAVSFPEVVTTFTSFFNPDEVYGLERTTYYLTGLRLFLMHPVLGVGSGNYQFFDLVYAEEGVAGFAHNQFITIAAETGALGLGMFLWFLHALWKLTKKLSVLKRDPSDPHYWIKAAGSVSLLGWVVQCSFGEPFFATAAAGGGTRLLTMIIFSWVLLGVLFAVCRLEASPCPVVQPLLPRLPKHSQAVAYARSLIGRSSITPEAPNGS